MSEESIQSVEDDHNDRVKNYFICLKKMSTNFLEFSTIKYSGSAKGLPETKKISSHVSQVMTHFELMFHKGNIVLELKIAQ